MGYYVRDTICADTICGAPHAILHPQLHSGVYIFHKSPYYPYIAGKMARNGGEIMRLPRHIGITRMETEGDFGPGMEKPDGYRGCGISLRMTLYHMCRQLGIDEMSFYGFTVDQHQAPQR